MTKVFVLYVILGNPEYIHYSHPIQYSVRKSSQDKQKQQQHQNTPKQNKKQQQKHRRWVYYL